MQQKPDAQDGERDHGYSVNKQASGPEKGIFHRGKKIFLARRHERTPPLTTQTRVRSNLIWLVDGWAPRSKRAGAIAP
jgi:hypothetical protein